jgi:class 3 adenylate cyclase
VSDLRALALIYDIRGFTAASKRLRTADLGAFATGAHRVVLDQFASHPPTFVKNLGDGHLLLWECPDGLEADLVEGVVSGAGRARTAFAAFAQAQREQGLAIPGHVGIGVAFGEVSRSDDYYGRALNLAARLQNEARPEGLALDGDVFAAVTRREAGLRERFKRARVHLRGLGSTVVYVDRPFSWLRALAPVLRLFAAVALPLGYLLLCDAGLSLPGAEGVRRALDARDLSLLRPVEGEARVRDLAQAQRRRLVEGLLGARVPAGWFATAFPPTRALSAEEAALQASERAADEEAPDVWSTSQAAYALLRAPGMTRLRFQQELVPIFERLHGPQELVERDGVLWGWRPRRHERYTQAEPTLWTVAATAAALAVPGLLIGEERSTFARRLARAQEAALTFRPTEGGGWNIFPRQRVPERYSPYSTTLALLALLESRAAGLGWQGDAARLERMLAQTAAFLGRTFVADADPPGWRRTAEASDKISAGLTLQACATLLRAEAEAGVEMPAQVLAAIPALLVERAAARAYDDYDMGEFIVEFTPLEGDMASGKEGINFLSHPWAIECAARWLARAERGGSDGAERVRVRRALGQLVVHLGEEAVAKALGGYLFVASETLIGLSSIPASEGR